MKRSSIYAILIGFIIFSGCSSSSNSKYKDKYDMYKLSYFSETSNPILWILLDKHDGTTVELMEIKNDQSVYIGYNNYPSTIKAGVYVKDESLFWESNPYPGYNLKTFFNTMQDAIRIADKRWYAYSVPLEKRYVFYGTNLKPKGISDKLFAKVEMPN